MVDQQRFEEILHGHELGDFQIIGPGHIEVAHWVRMKCRYGCPDYGRCAVCPPNVPSVEECRAFFAEYHRAALIHVPLRVDDPEQRHAATRAQNLRLLAVERDVFLAGTPKAFVFFIDPCNICRECHGDPADCKDPSRARPAPEGFGVDVFGMARKAGYEIEVLRDYAQTMHRFALLMID